ncbi:MAG TPA: transposase [Gammaproteobacteria bacterium]|nr:transposase [Gammaproteobacteria bacterium]
MPRKPRMYMPGVPCHVIQRGNNREPCFFTEEDYRFYLVCLGEACERFGVALHAYVQMTNHVHLLMTPASESGISRVMQSLGRRYVQHINQTYHRCGTLWESRHKANIVDAECYLLTCYRYIELNPVRAGMVEHPGDYAWSSYQRNACGKYQAYIREHEIYTQLGRDPATRQAAYRDLFSDALDRNVLHAIRTSATSSMPLGNDRFREKLEEALGRRVGYAGRGRPKRRRNPDAN